MRRTSAPRGGSAEALPPEGGLESVDRPVGARSAAVDGLRALASLAVVVTHVGFESGRSLSGVVGAVVGRLDVGVAVFFALSGYLLGRPFVAWAQSEEPRPSLRRYAARRAGRVLPAYWVMLTVALAVLRPEELRTLGDLFWQYALAQTYEDYRLLPALSHVWSLSTEVAFYASLPVLAWGLAVVARRPEHAVRRQLLLLAALSVGGLVFLALAHADGGVQAGVQPQWLPARFDWFAGGLALAVLTSPLGVRTAAGRAVGELARAPGLCWTAAACLFWIACTPVAGGRGLVPFTAHEAIVRELLYGGTAVLLLLPLVAGPAQGGHVRAVLQSRVAVWLGQVSYGLFLWHKIVLEVLQRSFGLEVFEFAFVPVLVATLVLSLGIAALSWVLVERPLLRLVDRWLAGRSRHTPSRRQQRDGGDAEREQREQLRQDGVGAR